MGETLIGIVGLILVIAVFLGPMFTIEFVEQRRKDKLEQKKLDLEIAKENNRNVEKLMRGEDG